MILGKHGERMRLYVDNCTDTKLIQTELSFGLKLKFSNPYIFATRYNKPLIFQTLAVQAYTIHSLKYLLSTTMSCYEDYGIRNS